MNTWAELDGRRIYVEIQGEGPTAIVVPVAWGASHEFLLALLGNVELPLQLVHFDPEGTGASDGLTPGWNPARVVDEVEAVRRAVAPDQPTILLGHASGAYLSLAYALDHPDTVEAAILVSPFSGYRRANDMSVARVESHPEWAAFSRRVAEIRRAPLTPTERFRAVFKEQRVLDMFEYGSHYFEMADAADQTDFNPAMHDDTETDLLDELHLIEAPVLIITGEDDPLSPLEEARLIAGQLPYVRLVEFARCGHFPFVEEPSDSDRRSQTSWRRWPSDRRLQRAYP